MRRRHLIQGLGAVGAGVGFMLAVGAWRSDRQGPFGANLSLTGMGWSLSDDRGNAVKPQDWLGKTTLVFFGFTYCPDVCPTTLIDIGDWLLALEQPEDALNVVLISVDPDRDTPQALAEYLSNFDPRIRGLTGPRPQIDRAVADFGASYEYIPGDDGDYTVNHTAGVFVFRPDGRLASIIDFHEDRSKAVPKIRNAMAT